MNKKDKVLIVEDQDDLRDLLKSILEENGFSVLTAFDGVDAVEVFTEHKDEIGVVLSDIGLPRLGGWDALIKMREIEPDLKGILASGYFHENVKEEIIRSGAKTMIQKPYNTPQVVAMIRKLLAGDDNI
jgi:two-component system, cell cycle sensor histidine kinase and response regulator CckA